MKSSRLKKQIVFLILAAASALGAASRSHADVDLRRASYIHYWMDVPKLLRTYNSRAMQNGLFGFGWCSDLDLKLRVSQNKIEFLDCRWPEPIRFQSTDRPAVFISERPYWMLTLSGQTIRLTSAFGENLKFTLQGRFEERDDTDGSSLRVRRDKAGNITTLETSQDGRRTRIQVLVNHTLGKVMTLKTAGRPPIRFTYAGLNLVKVQSGSEKALRYSYDDTANLIKVEYPDGTFDRMDYDKGRDRIVRIKDRKGCDLRLSYSTLSLAQNRFRIRTRSLCHGTSTSRSIDLQYTEEAGHTQLSEARFHRSGKVVSILFDKRWARPKQITMDGRSLHYSYDEHGRVDTVWSDALHKLRAVYSPDGQIETYKNIAPREALPREIASASSKLIRDAINMQPWLHPFQKEAP